MLLQLAIQRSLIRFSLITSSLVLGLPVNPQEKQGIQQEVESIQFVDQVKSRIQELMTALDQCGRELMTGLDQDEVVSCLDSNFTAIWEQVGMLDIRVDGKIFSGGTGWTESVLPITFTDLALMKQIFRQYKPTNYQYWNWNSVLHLWYNPDCPTDQPICKALGLAPSKRCPQ